MVSPGYRLIRLVPDDSCIATNLVPAKRSQNAQSAFRAGILPIFTDRHKKFRILTESFEVQKNQAGNQRQIQQIETRTRI